MNCTECQENLVAYLEGALPAPEAQTIEAHLQACPACSTELTEYARLRDRLMADANALGRVPLDTRVMNRVFREQTLKLRRRAMRKRYGWIGLGMAAAAAVAVLWVTTSVRPSGDHHAASRPWWAGSSVAWASEIRTALEMVKALTYREQPIFVGAAGSTHVSGSWSKHYEAPDRSRVDQYYEDKLVSTRWDVPEQKDLLHYDVSYEYECYTIDPEPGRAYQRDPVEKLRFYEQFRDRADRVLGTKTIDGRNCVGFELSASKYGDNPQQRIDRIWVEVETRLPVRIERHGLPITDHPEETLTQIEDRFEYYADVPAEMFTPNIPAGYANTHPDNVRRAREALAKGPMDQAQVPADWKERAVAALKAVKTMVYRENGCRRISVSQFAWRVDMPYEAGRPTWTDWSVIEKDDPAKTSLDVTDKAFRLVYTSVDYPKRMYTQKVFGAGDHPRHPMDKLLDPIGNLDRADRILEPRDIDGIRCVGAEISAKKYGTNPDGMLHRLWFDEKTMLPVRMEFEWGDRGRTPTFVKDRFEWNPEFPPDTFVPVIPEGFTSTTDTPNSR
jgi:outer membrane lipoprotein-sorting protein